MTGRTDEESAGAGRATSERAMSAIERTLASPWRTALVVALVVLALSWVSTDQQRRFAETRMPSPEYFRLNVWAMFLPELAHFVLWALLAPTLLGFMLWTWNRLHPAVFVVVQVLGCFGAAWGMGFLEFHVTRELVQHVTGPPVTRVESRVDGDEAANRYVGEDRDDDGRDARGPGDDVDRGVDGARAAATDEVERGAGEATIPGRDPLHGGLPPAPPPTDGRSGEFGPLGPEGPPPPDRRGWRDRFDRDRDRGRGGFDPRRFRSRPVDGVESAQRQFGREVMHYLLTLGLAGAAFAFLRRRQGERRTHQLEVEAAALEGELARTQLRSLRAQLQPHFLFNALHGIGGLVREKREGEALRTLSDLGGLLRRTLDADRVDRWSLGSEIALVEEYLSVESVRLGDRLATAIEVAEDAASIQLPPLLLLPIVENAIRHGVATQARGGRVAVRARRSGERLRIEVDDTGPGFPAAVLRAGRHPADDEVHVGLQNTRERLGRLYPGRHSFELSNRHEGGASVVIEIPVDA